MAQLDLLLGERDRPRSAAPSVRRRASAPKPPAPQLCLPLEARIESGSDGPPEIAPTIRGQERLEKVLRARLGPKVIVALTSNRNTMISFTRRKGVLYVRAQAIFADAPEPVLSALAAYVAGRETTPENDAILDRWIELNRHLVKKSDGSDLVIQPYGEMHDLQAILDRLNRAHFGDQIKARITWSRAAKNQKRRSIRLGSYCEDHALIRIHPALDREDVPEVYVASVVFHEMLHERHGVVEEDGRRCVHTPAFVQDEKLFPEYEEARAWEAKHLHRLLRY